MKKMQHRAGNIVNSARLGFRRRPNGRSGKHPGPKGQRTIRPIFRLYRASGDCRRVLRAAAPERRPPLSRP